MPRRLLIAAALGAACAACAAAAPDLQAELAWKGWVRPGRPSEVEVRVAAAQPLRATLEVAAGAQRARAELDLQPGRPLVLHWPVATRQRAAPVVVSLQAAGAPAQRLELSPAPSEAPLLGVALAGEAAAEAGAVGLQGFHAVTLAPADLPRHAAAYAGMDALVLDAPTLAALDARQLSALLAHLADCGRVAVLRADARVRGLLAGARGCGGAGLVLGEGLPELMQHLQQSLAEPLAAPQPREALGELAQPSLTDWNRVLLAAGMAAALMLLALIFTASPAVLLAVPALTAVALALLPRLATPQPQLLIWSEGDSGAQLARYQAWLRFPGLSRGSVRAALPQQLAAGALPCEAARPVRFEIDAASGQPAFAEFETRLFGQVWFCQSGGFPMARAFDTDLLAGGMRQVRNRGQAAWPEGSLLVAGQAQALPALAPGGALRLPVVPAGTADDPAVRAALPRLRPGTAAALWPLELAGVAGAPADAQGWMLVAAGAAP